MGSRLVLAALAVLLWSAALVRTWELDTTAGTDHTGSRPFLTLSATAAAVAALLTGGLTIAVTPRPRSGRRAMIAAAQAALAAVAGLAAAAHFGWAAAPRPVSDAPRVPPRASRQGARGSAVVDPRVSPVARPSPDVPATAPPPPPAMPDATPDTELSAGFRSLLVCLPECAAWESASDAYRQHRPDDPERRAPVLAALGSLRFTADEIGRVFPGCRVQASTAGFEDATWPSLTVECQGVVVAEAHPSDGSTLRSVRFSAGAPLGPAGEAIGARLGDAGSALGPSCWACSPGKEQLSGSVLCQWDYREDRRIVLELSGSWEGRETRVPPASVLCRWRVAGLWWLAP